MSESYEAKLARQIQLERKMQSLGIDRYESSVKNAVSKETESHTTYGMRLMDKAIGAVSKNIEEVLAKASNGKAGRQHLAIKYIKEFDPKVLAFIALRVTIDGISKQRPLLQVALKIGNMLEDERRFTTLEENEPGLYKKLTRQIKRKNERQKSSIGVHTMNKWDIDFDVWPKTDKVHIGQKLIEAVILATGICEVRTRQDKNKDSRKCYLAPTEKTKEWIAGENSRNPLYTPMTLPCIVPPKKYTTPFDGGYFSEYIPMTTNVMVKSHNKRYLEELKNLGEDLQVVYDGVNAMAGTAWKINKQVLDILRYCWDKDTQIGGLPPRDDLPMPCCPVCGADLTLDVRAMKNHPCLKDKTVLKKWKQLAAMAYEENTKLWSHRFATQTYLWIAEMFENEDEIYFPVTLDFRGRAYYTPSFLNPQSTEQAKSLLLFAQGKPIDTNEAERWLAIHGANSYGKDKLSFDDRVEWVYENEQMILDIASAPLDTTKYWANESVDSPWMFLAFCFEWAAYRKHGRGYCSSLCISLDGSANGIQHLSACLKDPVGAAAVNMTKGEKPADIYGVVANKVNEKLSIIYRSTQDEKERYWAKKWLDFGVNRKITKRPVMTLPYGSTLYSCREYIEEGAKELMLKGHVPAGFFNTEENELFKASLFLQNIVWSSIGEVVVAGRQVMGWLQNMAREVTRTGMPVTWQTPSGFYVSQAYYERSTKRIKTQIAGSRIDLSIGDLTTKLDIKKQASSIAPNFIHSMDASAMMLCIDRAMKHGVTHFGMVHDSYGTHAADTETLAHDLRESFVNMYKEHDVLLEFRQHLSYLMDGDDILPTIPPMGNFNLDEILDADYFFS